MHRRVHVAEVPLIGGHLAGRVKVVPRQHQVNLALREGGVDHGERDAMERQVPGGVPRVLPLVGHGHHVVVEHVEPRLVPGAMPDGRPQRVEAALPQPAVHVEVIALLGPQHPGQGLAHDCPRVVGHGRRRDGLVELVRLGPPLSDQLAGGGERLRQLPRSLAGEPHQHRCASAARHGQPDMRCHLGALANGIHGVRAVQEVIADAVLGEARRRLGAEHPHRVRLVLAEQQGRSRFGVEVEDAELVMLGPDRRVRRLGPGDTGDPRPGLVVPPRPGVAEPQRGQRVQHGIPRRAVVHGDAAQDVLGPGLGVLHLDVEIVAAIEHARIDELVLEFMAGPGPVQRYQLAVGELRARVLVQVALVAVRGQVVDVEVVLLDVLTVIAFGIGQAEQTLLQDRVALVPQRQGQAQPLLVVADSGDAVLPPPVGAGPRLVMTEIRPGVFVVAVVLPDRPPLALAEIRPPGAPRNARPGLPQPLFLGRQRRRIRHGGRLGLGHALPLSVKQRHGPDGQPPGHGEKESEHHHLGARYPDDLIKTLRERYWCPEGRQPTITELAQEHGIAVAVVSRWLHGQGRRDAGGPTSRI